MLFTATRYAHTACFLAGLQPWRTLAYGVGILCTFAMCAHILLALF